MPCGEGSARHPYLDLVVVGLRAPLHRPPARLGPVIVATAQSHGLPIATHDRAIQASG